MKWFAVNKGVRYKPNGVEEYTYYELYDVYTGTIFFKFDSFDNIQVLDEYELVKYGLKEICLSTTDFDTPISYNRIISMFRDNKLKELGI